MSINTFRFRGNIFIMNLREFLGEDDCGSEIWFHSNQRITLHSNRKQDYVSFKEIDDSNRLLTLDRLVRMSERCPLGVITLCDQWSLWSLGDKHDHHVDPTDPANCVQAHALSSHYPRTILYVRSVIAIKSIEKKPSTIVNTIDSKAIEMWTSGESCVRVVWELLGLSSTSTGSSSNRFLMQSQVNFRRESHSFVRSHSSLRL